MEDPYENDDDEGWVEVGSKKKPEKPKPGSSKTKKGNNKRLRENNGKNGKFDRPSSSQSEPNYKTRSKRIVTPSLDPAISVFTDMTTNMSKMSIDNESTKDPTDGKVVAIVVESNPSVNPDVTAGGDIEPFSSRDFHILCSTISPHSCPIQTLPTRGLINTKSECFRNCVLQSLFSLPVFRNVLTHINSAFFEQNFSSSFSSNYWREFLYFARHFFFDVSVTPKAQNTRLNMSISASEQMPTLCHAFDTLMSQYNPSSITTQNNNSGKGKGRKRGGIQQDAMEFLTFFLDVLHEELLTLHHQQSLLFPPEEEEEKSEEKGATSNSTSLSSEQTHFLHRLQHIGHETSEEEDEWNTVTRKTRVSVKIQVDEPSRQRAKVELFSTLISRLFHGLLRSEVHYKMKRVVSVTFQRFHCLTLDCLGTNPDRGGLNPGGADLSLDTILHHYFQEEIVDENMKKSVKFEFLPSILILQLNRFSFDYSRNIAVKVGTRVNYPEKLEILPFYMSDSLAAKNRVLGNEKQCFYQLQSVVLHLGKKATGGHYISYTRSEDGSGGGGWRVVDDVKSNVITEEFALSACATVYILFYTKIEEGEDTPTALPSIAAGGEEKERS